MAEIHQTIAMMGVDEARRLAVTARERQAVETAYKVLSDEADTIGFTYSGFALTSLPHRAPKETLWRREAPNLTLVLQSGVDRAGKPIGIPYGSYARFILLFLQTEAIRTKSREIELGSSMKMWLSSMGLSIGGITYQAVKEQSRRISSCRLSFFSASGSHDFRRDGGFVRDSTTVPDSIEDQFSLWRDKVVLDEVFYRELCDHPVPVSEAALRAIGPRSMVLDIYIWLAYRLHALRDNTPLSWAAVSTQFGLGYARQRRFREHFLECLELALAAYPDARVSVAAKGITLHPSRPPIAKLT